MSRYFDGISGGSGFNQLTSATSAARTTAWTACAWVRLAEPVGSDATANYLIVARNTASPYGVSGIRVVKVGGRWVPSAMHDMTGTDAVINGVDAPWTDWRGWRFVAASHVSTSAPPRLWVASLGGSLVEMSRVAGQFTAGTGSTDAATSLLQIGGYGATNVLRGLVAWAAWWDAELTRDELALYMAATSLGTSPAGVRPASLRGLWPLNETDGTAAATDWSQTSRTLNASSFASGDVGEQPIRPADPEALHRDLLWWSGHWIDASAGLRGAGTLAVDATVTRRGTVAFSGAGTLAASTATSRDLDGSGGFSAAGVAVTGDWTWSGQAVLDQPGGYLWHTASAAGARVQSVSVAMVAGKARVSAYQARATTASECVWEIPVAVGDEAMLCYSVEYLASTGRFRCWIGRLNRDRTQPLRPAETPMMELQWCWSVTVGAGASVGGGTVWSVSPPTGRIDGRVAWYCLHDYGLSADHRDQIRRFASPPTGAGLLGWWRFDESGGNAADSSSYGRTMVPSGTVGVGFREEAPPPESTSGQVRIGGVSDYQVFQRDDLSPGSGKATVPLTITYTGNPTRIDVLMVAWIDERLPPPQWQAVAGGDLPAPPPGPGLVTGTVEIPAGIQGVLTVRATYADGVAFDRRHTVGCGDIWLIVGTSNASGIEQTGKYSRIETLHPQVAWGGGGFGRVIPTMLSNQDVGGVHQWCELHDPFDTFSSPATDLSSRTTSIFAPDTTWQQDDLVDGTREQPTGATFTGAGQSWAPHVAARIAALARMPVAVLPLGRGASNAASWMEAATHVLSTKGAMWNELRSRCEQLSGQTWTIDTPLTPGYAAGILAVMGENDYGASTLANYEGPLSNATSIRHWGQVDLGDYLGLRTHMMVVGDWPGPNAYGYGSNPNDGITRVRVANQKSWDQPAILPGPNAYDIDLADGGGSADGFHYRTDYELETLADRWVAAVTPFYYDAFADPVNDPGGPKVVSVTRTDDRVYVRYDAALDDPGGGYNGLSVYAGTPSAATRLAWTSGTPSAGQYSAVRDSDPTRVAITLGDGIPTLPIYYGCGEYDLSAGKRVPMTTRTFFDGALAVSLPAEVSTGLYAMPVVDANVIAFVGAGTLYADGTVTIGGGPGGGGGGGGGSGGGIVSSGPSTSVVFNYRGLEMSPGYNDGYVVSDYVGVEDTAPLDRAEQPWADRHGSWFGTPHAKPRVVTISGIVSERIGTADDLRAKVRALRGAMSPVPRAGAVGEDPFTYPLTMIDPDGAEWTLYARPADSGIAFKRPMANGRLREFQLTLEAPDPLWYSAESFVATLVAGSASVGAFRWKVRWPVVWRPPADSGSVIDIASIAPTPPTLTIEGPVGANTTIINESLPAQNQITIASAIASGNTLVIDGRTRSVTVNGTPAPGALRTDSSWWWWLMPGMNDVRFNGVGTVAGETTVTLRWRSTMM